MKRQVGRGPGFVWGKGFYIQVSSRDRSVERGRVRKGSAGLKVWAPEVDARDSREKVG